jgi:hypothetical protein
MLDSEICRVCQCICVFPETHSSLGHVFSERIRPNSSVSRKYAFLVWGFFDDFVSSYTVQGLVVGLQINDELKII